MLPRVTSLTREEIALDLDGRGPAACIEETLGELRETNPEILDIATKCAASFGSDSADVMLELCMFYRALAEEFRRMDQAMRLLAPLPRVTEKTRANVVEQIDLEGVEAFTVKAIDDLEAHNSELLQMAHNSAIRLGVYYPVMQGFALLYRTLAEQAAADNADIAFH